MKRTVSVIIPTYNEKDNIVDLLKEIERQLQYVAHEVIVVDDQSSDGTGLFVKRVYKDNPRIHCFIRSGQRDLGKSILYGLRKCKGDFIIGMDADFNHDPCVLPHLLQSIENSDLVIASRFIAGGGMEDRYLYGASLLFNIILKLLFGFPIWDNTSCYYCIRKKTLEKLNPSTIYYGYGEYHLRLVYRAQHHRLRIREVPVYYHKRRHGQSKSRLPIMLVTYLKTVLALRLGFQ